MEELNARQQSVLKVIVSEYILSARPVGSDTVVDKYDLEISPAPVPNAMTVPEPAGPLPPPHTTPCLAQEKGTFPKDQRN